MRPRGPKSAVYMRHSSGVLLFICALADSKHLVSTQCFGGAPLSKAPPHSVTHFWAGAAHTSNI
jgi:hypothetical protein